MNTESNNNNNNKVSVITVVFNAIEKIEETILSVINQDYNSIEYIVIDGGSSDGTVDIIKKYSKQISLLISEEDLGIYHAMNKGLDKSTGQWVNFMNAGDTFTDKSVIRNVFENVIDADIDVVYGNSIVRKQNDSLHCFKANKPISELWKGPVFRHGAMFTRTDVHKMYPFKLNIKYKVCADFDFIYKINVLGHQMKYVDVDVIIFEEDGISNNGFKNLKYNRMILLSYKHTFKQNIISLMRSNVFRVYFILQKVKSLIK